MRVTFLLTVFTATALALPAAIAPVEGKNATLAAREALLAELAARTVIPHPENSKLEMEERKTASGKKYRVVRPTGSMAKEKELAKRGELNPIHVEKRQYPGHFWTWTNPVWKLNTGGSNADGTITDAWREQTGITAFSLDFGGIFYKIRLNFWEYKYQSNYGFLDQSGDWYWCNVIIFGHHYIDYNSDKPNIVAVQGQ